MSVRAQVPPEAIDHLRAEASTIKAACDLYMTGTAGAAEIDRLVSGLKWQDRFAVNATVATIYLAGWMACERHRRQAEPAARRTA